MENLAIHKFCPGFSGIKGELFIRDARTNFYGHNRKKKENGNPNKKSFYL